LFQLLFQTKNSQLGQQFLTPSQLQMLMVMP